MNTQRRRAFLATVSTATVSALAGCTDLFGDELAGDANGDDSERDKTAAKAAIPFVEDLADERFEQAHERVAPDAQVSVGELEQLWLGYAAVGGEFQEVADTAETEASGFDAADVTMAFERGEHELRVLVTDDRDVAGIAVNDAYERPSYVDRDAITEDGATLESKECSLQGTVALPADADSDSVPGVVLVHDSGPADRDLSRDATKAFADLAEGLASEGIATLRYDKRTYACPGRVEPEDSTLDAVTVDDALLAVDELRGVEAVDDDRTVVVGLGLGGTAVPRIVARDGDLAGGVAMAAPGRPFHDVVLAHLEHQAAVGSHDWPAMTAEYEKQADEIDRIRDGDYGSDDVVLDFPGAFWESLAEYDALETARGIDEPLYFLQGERDFQASLEDDFRLWQSELEDRSDTSFDSYDGLNHLLMPVEGPGVAFEYRVRNNVDSRVIADLADWIETL
ncbi:alpha/beta hydrolase [Natronococcus wangiae]|uniref:alpha/beta hydrolase n=1 Tax=Natronococcus wangiae TaxID=3068275 RepID=UPI00273E4927|nr:alpha/beta hydrolase [Natronococcus sp. AD5]